MSCPDWRTLSRRRQADPGAAPEWHAALVHLDQCSSCQAAAPAFDPTLMFRRLPAFELGRDEVEAMKQAVTGMRRGETIERRRNLFGRSWRHAAALAAVLLGALLLRGSGWMPAGTQPTASAAGTLAPAAASESDVWQMPLIETADPTYGSIIQVVDDDISVVLVVPTAIGV